MSGVYIEMEMPIACCACPCNYDNVCAIANKFPTFEEWYEIKPSWCPLVPVPDHGRLIDADVMEDSLSDLLRFPSNLVNGQWIVNTIREQPTIIPADKDGA